MSKIATREKLKELYSDHKGKVIGFTSGSFDLLHAGHVDYLQKAKKDCDILIVAVNSDDSVKKYKSELRPIVTQDSRVKVVAGLECVDHVFIFNELNNNVNIEELKPDIYFKAGDYSNKPLTSAKIIEAYGGKVVLVPLVEDSSTSDIINTILENYSAAKNEYIKAEDLPESKAIILDRDGTINVHVNYLHKPEEFELLPGVIEGLKHAQKAGYKLIVITNQPGVDFGYFKMEDLFKVNKQMLSLLSKEGILIEKIYFSPYTKARGADCRKPATALIKRAEKELNLNLKESYMIGDSTSDVKMGKNADCKTILVQTGNAGEDNLCEATPDHIIQDLSELSKLI